MNEEAGEVAGKVKKIIRDKGGFVGFEDREAIKKELGDVLWCLSQTAGELGLDLECIAQANIDKLECRLSRGMIGGSGDSR